MRPRATSIVLASVLAAALALTGAAVPGLQAPVEADAPSAVLPWDMPDRSTLVKGRPVFAQYFVPHPVSFDNLPAESDFYQTELIDPMGKDGAYAAYGGALRDRPLPRLVRPEVDWKSEDLKTEVRQAIAAGLDGFAVGVLNPSGRNYDQAVALIEAAEAVDPTFKIVITPDMAGPIGDVTSAAMAQLLADLTGQGSGSGWRVRTSTYRLADGRVVLHPFPTTRRSANFWSQVQTEYTRLTGQRLALWGGFPDVKQQADAYLPVIDGLASWGEANLTRNPDGPTGVAENTTYAHDLGKKWMQPVHAFDQRPVLHGTEGVNGYYGETRATEVLSRQWTGAIAGGADAVQLITWNDYSESAVAPSVGQGWGPLDLSSYFLIKYKTGQYPQIRRDAVYLTHRHQFADAKPRCATYQPPKIPCTLPMTIKEGTNPAEDIVEAQTFLTAPGSVTLTVGSTTVTYEAPAGRYVKRVPLALGAVSATVRRSGSTVAQVDSPYRVVSTPEVQDMQYHIVSSLRGANVDATPPSTPGTPVMSVDGLAANLAWAASADDVELYGYEVHRSQSAAFTPSEQTKIALVRSTTFSDGGRPPGTWYYRVRAIDLAGNVSAPSGVGSAAAPGQSMTDPVASDLVADTYVNGTKESTVYGTDPSLGSYGTPDVATFLKFKVPQAPAGQVLRAAKLLITTTSLSSAGSTDDQSVRIASNDWSESATNYLNRPQVAEQVVGTVKGGMTPDTQYEAWLDVNAVSQGVGGTLTLSVRGTGGDGAWFVARESGVKRSAELLVQFGPEDPPPPSGSGQTVSVKPTQDTFVNSTKQSTVFGDDPSLGSYGTPDVSTYLKFDVPQAPPGQVLRTAKLAITTTSLASAGSADEQVVRVASDDWSEAATNYLNRPQVQDAVIGSIKGGTSADTRYEAVLDVGAVSGRAGGSLSLALGGTGGDGAWYVARESTVNRPAELLVEFEPDVAPPPTGTEQTVTVQPSQDTYVHSLSRNTVYGKSASQAVEGDPDIVSYMEYQIPAAPGGMTLKTARLVMRATAIAAAGTTDAVDVRLASGPVSEATTVYGNHPGVGASLGRLEADVRPDESFAVDLSVSEVSKLTGKTATLALTGSGEDSLWLTTSESATGGCALELTYA